jgi:hypothetical protein
MTNPEAGVIAIRSIRARPTTVPEDRPTSQSAWSPSSLRRPTSSTRLRKVQGRDPTPYADQADNSMVAALSAGLRPQRYFDIKSYQALVDIFTKEVMAGPSTSATSR